MRKDLVEQLVESVQEMKAIRAGRRKPPLAAWAGFRRRPLGDIAAGGMVGCGDHLVEANVAFAVYVPNDTDVFPTETTQSL